MNRGRWVILVIFGLAGAVGVLSVGLHYWISRRAIAWWGHDAAALIQNAPQVAALQLQPHFGPAHGGPTDTAETVTIGGVGYDVVRRKDLAGQDGLDHLRNSLLEDMNFAWNAPPPAAPSQWRFALEFRDGAKRLVIVLDPTGRRLARAETGASLAIAPIATGWEDFFAEQFGTAHAAGVR